MEVWFAFLHVRGGNYLTRKRNKKINKETAISAPNYKAAYIIVTAAFAGFTDHRKRTIAHYQALA